MLGGVSGEFTGRIDRRLSLVFGSLFALVLLVGGISLYLLGSLLLRSEDIARDSERVHLAERIHRSLQDLFGAVQMARLQGRPIPAAARDTYAKDLESFVIRYGAAGGDGATVLALRDVIGRAGALAETLGPDDVLEATRQDLHALTERISAGHEATEHRQVRQAGRMLWLTIGVNVLFVIAGSLLLMAAQRYFRRSIARPLRRLTERSGEIARGQLATAMPVTSTDEIGRLSHAFNRMAQQLREHEERLKGMVILEERERLARELHDDLAQDLAFLRLKLIEADRSLGPSTSAGTRLLVKETFSIVDRGYQNLRQAIFGLRALDVEASGGLVPALRDYLGDFSEVRKIPVMLEVSGDGVFQLGPQAQSHLIRIVHEALTNIVKHADASKGIVRLEKDGDTARITVEDDGKGFAVEKIPEDGLHFGLQAMRGRAEAAGGTLTVDSSPGQGARVIVRLPLARP